MSVKLLKLSCGDLLIADVADGQSGDEVLVKRPLRMVISTKGIGLRMWMPCSLEQAIPIRRSHIITETEAEGPLAQEYQSKFGGAIVTPDKPKLVVPG
jgi:hypothetical protein